MSRFLRQVVGLHITVFCLLACSGCQSYSAADFDRIQNDPTLTDQQRHEKLATMMKTDQQQEQVYPYLFIIAGAVVVILIVLLIPKKMKDGALASTVQPGGARGSTAGAEKLPARGAGAPLPAAAPKPAAAPTHQPYAPPAATQSVALVGPTADAALEDVTTEPPMPVNHLPENQQEVDEIPTDEQGVSFFSSRPLPRWALEELTIVIGDCKQVVMATPQECRSYREGNPPKVQGFSASGKTYPWYEFRHYDPYRHYWIARDRNWNIFRGAASSALLSVEDLNPELPGYYEVDVDGVAAPEAYGGPRPPAASEPAPSRGGHPSQ